jgi:hypothetical protein
LSHCGHARNQCGSAKVELEHTQHRSDTSAMDAARGENFGMK